MNKRTTTEILADALDYVERHGPVKLGVELREVYRQSIGESPPDDNRWRSVAEQLYKALDQKMGCGSECKCSGQAALSAFDSLRKEESND